MTTSEASDARQASTLPHAGAQSALHSTAPALPAAAPTAAAAVTTTAAAAASTEHACLVQRLEAYMASRGMTQAAVAAAASLPSTSTSVLSCWLGRARAPLAPRKAAEVDALIAAYLNPLTKLDAVSAGRGKRGPNGCADAPFIAPAPSSSLSTRVGLRGKRAAEQQSRLPVAQYGEEVMNRRLAVRFVGGKWYSGVVGDYSALDGEHTIFYDDGDMRRHRLAREEAKGMIRWEQEPKVRPVPAPSVAPRAAERYSSALAVLARTSLGADGMPAQQAKASSVTRALAKEPSASVRGLTCGECTRGLEEDSVPSEAPFKASAAAAAALPAQASTSVTGAVLTATSRAASSTVVAPTSRADESHKALLGGERVREPQPAADHSTADASRCKRQPLCIRGVHHGGRGGPCHIPSRSQRKKDKARVAPEAEVEDAAADMRGGATGSLSGEGKAGCDMSEPSKAHGVSRRCGLIEGCTLLAYHKGLCCVALAEGKRRRYLPYGTHPLPCLYPTKMQDP